MVEPASIIKVFSVLWSFRAKGFNIDLTTLAEILNFQISIHSSLGHTSEVAWAIWALIVFQIQMTNEAAVTVSKMGDSVIALLCLDARQQGLVPGGLNTTLWESFMAVDELYGEQWLLSYEANQKGWLPSIGTPDHVATDPCFSFLKSLGVEFYNSNRALTSTPTFVSPSLQTAPLFSLP